jgi:hypothetical protein
MSSGSSSIETCVPSTAILEKAMGTKWKWAAEFNELFMD